jgi:hypothetical protein
MNKQNSEKFNAAVGCLEEALNGKGAHASFEEAVLIIDHTSYHTGEIIVARRLLKDWK